MISSDGPPVTIGIPTYNRANNFLRNGLGSELNQTYTKLEIIVSDNRSTDQTESLVRDFSDPRIRFMKYQENICAINESVGLHVSYNSPQGDNGYQSLQIIVN